MNFEIKELQEKIKNIENEFGKFNNETTKLNEDIKISEKAIDNAEKAILKYEGKMTLAKTVMIEDYAIATLSKDFNSLGIVGYIFNLLKWEEKYQKAIIASGSDWMKSIVVKDIKSMVKLAEFSKNKGIPFLKIIPIELLDGKKIKDIPSDPYILGILSDFINSKVKNLGEFLFGNIVLTKNPSKCLYII